MEIVEAIIIDKKEIERSQIFEELYERAFPFVARFVRKMSGTLEDAKDIFQDALVIFYEKREQRNFILNTNPESYILGISKHLWIKKFKHDRNKISFSDWEHEIEIPHDYFPEYDDNLLLKFLETTGKKCLELLSAFYYEKLSMAKIADMYEYKNERSATVQKYKCLEKVRETIKQKSVEYEDFIK